MVVVPVLLLICIVFIPLCTSMMHIRRMHRGSSSVRLHSNKVYSTPDQPLRVAQAKETNNARFLDIDQFYNPELVKGKKVLVTGDVVVG